MKKPADERETEVNKSNEWTCFAYTKLTGDDASRTHVACGETSGSRYLRTVLLQVFNRGEVDRRFKRIA